ncbi:hypothetical protein K6L05_06190 [Salinicoccus roseus]|uniref:hypothetical protein n=1 Tax=Salinicoccus roseus TaxID=45670 RepID=UPI001CA68556|nr:hypothetical protein [Salinicoccus roseus]MBY8909381.1 hypothetical protein [Salinicoccus roseus]
MFDYQAAYKRNGTGSHMKTFWLTVLAIILMYAAGLLFLLVMLLPASFIDSGIIILWIFAVGFLFLLAGIFLLYPFSVGVLHYYACTYLGREFGFREAFKVFTNGRYNKVIKLGLLVLVAYVVVSFAFGLIMQFILTAVNMPLIMLAETWAQGSVPSGGQVGVIIGVVLLNFLVVMISYIPYMLIAIYVILAYMVYIDQPFIPTTDKFKIAWDVMFHSGERIWKLIFSNFLLLLMPLAVHLVFIVPAILLGIFVDGLAFPILMVAGVLIAVVAYAAAIYFMVGSITAYYFKGRSTLDQKHWQEVQG